MRNGLFGVQVIFNEYLTKEKTFTLRRMFLPGQRKGRDKRPIKVMGKVTRTVPSDEVFMVPGQHAIVMHPAYEETLKMATDPDPKPLFNFGFDWGISTIDDILNSTNRTDSQK